MRRAPSSLEHSQRGGGTFDRPRIGSPPAALPRAVAGLGHTRAGALLLDRPGVPRFARPSNSAYGRTPRGGGWLRHPVCPLRWAFRSPAPTPWWCASRAAGRWRRRGRAPPRSRSAWTPRPRLGSWPSTPQSSPLGTAAFSSSSVLPCSSVPPGTSTRTRRACRLRPRDCSPWLERRSRPCCCRSHASPCWHESATGPWPAQAPQPTRWSSWATASSRSAAWCAARRVSSAPI